MNDILLVMLVLINAFGVIMFIQDFCEDDLTGNGIQVKHIFYVTIFLPGTILSICLLLFIFIGNLISEKSKRFWNKKIK